jgi:hypothetical protein
VGEWIGSLADAQCRQLGEALHDPVLEWKRARFLAKKPGEPEGRQVDGVAAGPFGIYKDGPEVRGFILVHRPTGQRILRLGRLKDCKALARDLASLRLDWESTDPARVTGPDEDRAREVLGRYRAHSNRG